MHSLKCITPFHVTVTGEQRYSVRKNGGYRVFICRGGKKFVESIRIGEEQTDCGENALFLYEIPLFSGERDLRESKRIAPVFILDIGTAGNGIVQINIERKLRFRRKQAERQRTNPVINIDLLRGFEFR